MSGRVMLLLTSMALVLVAASGTAMAEEAQLDQEWAIHDTVREIDQYAAYQTARVGITGTVSKVAVLVGCCGGTVAPAGDLRVTVSSGGISSTANIPKANFTNDDVLRWVDVPLDTPIPVQGGSTPSGVVINLKNTSGSSPYLWALDTRSSGGTAGGYLWGGFVTCAPDWKDIECNPTGADANFRIYVIPGPDVIPPHTDLPSAEGGTTNGPPEESTSSVNRASFKFYAYENGYAAGSGITFECKLDDRSWETCTSPKEYTGLSDGSHTFQVRATDPSGNTDPTPESRQWFVDDTSPTVGGVSPADQAQNVVLSTNVEATFSEAMDPRTISGPNFNLMEQGSTFSVGGTVTYDSTTNEATLNPTSDLAPNKTYTATIEGGIFGVRDLAGNPLEQDYSWTFSTESETTPPVTTHTLSSQPNAAGWNKEDATLSLLASDRGSGVKEISYSINGAEPTTVQQISVEILINDEGATTISYHAVDKAGNVESERTSTVKLDKSAPTLDIDNSDGTDGITPDNGATRVSRDAKPTATFSDLMDLTSLGTSAKLYRWDAVQMVWRPVPVGMSLKGKTATLDPYPSDPNRLLAANTRFKATITRGATNLAGLSMSSPKSWTFTTK